MILILDKNKIYTYLLPTLEGVKSLVSRCTKGYSLGETAKRAESGQLQFWSKPYEILNLRFSNTIETVLVSISRYGHSSYNEVLLYCGILSKAVFPKPKTALNFYLTRFFQNKKKLKKRKIKFFWSKNFFSKFFLMI